MTPLVSLLVVKLYTYVNEVHTKVLSKSLILNLIENKNIG